MKKLENSLDFLRNIQTQYATTPDLFLPVETAIGCDAQTFIARVNAHEQILAKEYDEYKDARLNEGIAADALDTAETSLRNAYKQLVYALKAEYYPEAARMYPFIFEQVAGRGTVYACLQQVLANITTHSIQPQTSASFVAQASEAATAYDAAVLHNAELDGTEIKEKGDVQQALADAHLFVKIIKSVLRMAYHGHDQQLALLFPDSAAAQRLATTASEPVPTVA